MADRRRTGAPVERQETPFVRATGTSMLPTLLPGDALLVEYRQRRPRVGQIAVFRYGGQLVVHRVVSPGREMGDNMVRSRRFTADNVVGRVVRVQRRGRTLDLTTPGQQLRGLALAFRGLTRLARRRVAHQFDRLQAKTSKRGARKQMTEHDETHDDGAVSTYEPPTVSLIGTAEGAAAADKSRTY